MKKLTHRHEYTQVGCILIVFEDPPYRERPETLVMSIITFAMAAWASFETFVFGGRASLTIRQTTEDGKFKSSGRSAILRCFKSYIY